jgi:uncharacterized membrane protein YidH (DUF202 family)
MKQLIEGEFPLGTLTVANISLVAVSSFLHRIKPELDAALTVVQIVVGIITVIHVVKKWVQTRRAKNEKTPLPPSSTVPGAPM